MAAPRTPRHPVLRRSDLLIQDPLDFCFQVPGLPGCQVALNGSFSEKRLFKSAASLDTRDDFSRLPRSTCVQLAHEAAVAPSTALSSVSAGGVNQLHADRRGASKPCEVLSRQASRGSGGETQQPRSSYLVMGQE